MIILSGVLVVVAIALLGTAVVPGMLAGDGETAQVLGLDALMVIYLSIAVSVVSALCLAIGVFLRRKELFGGGASAAARKTAKSKNKSKGRTRKKADHSAPAAAGRGKAAPAQPGTGDTVVIPSPPAEVPADSVVFVVRGRKRYHLDTCRQLAGRDRDELTYAEAKEEGFSSCTACMPDTALAARAAVSVSAGTAKKPPGEESATAPLPRRVKPGESPEPPSAEAQRQAPPPKAPPSSALGAPPARPADEKDARPPGFRSDPLDTGPPFTGHGDPASGSGHDSPARTAPVEPLARPGADASRPRTPDAAAAAAGDAGGAVTVKILSGTRRYHRPGCALLEDIGDNADDLESLTRAEAKARDCTSCLVCRPDDSA